MTIENGLLIAVLEDDPEVSQLVKTVLTESDQRYDVTCFSSSGEFEKAIQEGVNPDLLILNLSLPDSYGTAIRKKLEESGSLTKVLILTAEVDNPNLEKFLTNHPVSGIVHKPFDISFLGETVKRILQDNLPK